MPSSDTYFACSNNYTFRFYYDGFGGRGYVVRLDLPPGATQFAASSVDDGHSPDVIVLDHLLDKKRRDIRARDPEAQLDGEAHIGDD
jgi:hypothetical protein